MEEPIQSNMENYQWDIMRQIARIAMDNNAIVYGGFVRDLLYKEFSTEVLPGTKLPADVDIVIRNDYVSEFMLECKMNNFSFQKTQSSVFVSDITPDCNESDFMVTRYKVSLDASFWKRASARFPVKLDVSNMISQCTAIPPVFLDIVTTDTEVRCPFATTPDFECNALFLDNHGLHVHPGIETRGSSLLAKYNKVNIIIQDIIARRAIMMHPPFQKSVSLAKRARHMFDKGWMVQDNVISTCKDAGYTGHCLLCHESLPDDHFKFQCCDARYHDKCMSSMLKNPAFSCECPMCRKHMPVTELPLCDMFLGQSEPMASSLSASS